MRSRVVLVVAGALAVLAAGALVWFLWNGQARVSPPVEVVVGESPETAPAPTSEEGSVAPPPPVVDRDGDGVHDGEETPGAEPSPTPSPSTPPQAPPPGTGDDCAEEDDDGDDDCDEDDDDD